MQCHSQLHRVFLLQALLQRVVVTAPFAIPDALALALALAAPAHEICGRA